MQSAISEVEESRYLDLQRLALDFARAGETESLAPMLRHGLPVNLCDTKGNSLLMLACYNGNRDTARMLLEVGARVDGRNDRGQAIDGGFSGQPRQTPRLLPRVHAEACQYR